ncbi:MAG TPA: hypothetical protein VMV69_22690 [Pirellulales bacterium]|nr:hypothetical protein [Pirellulales bacterium]
MYKALAFKELRELAGIAALGLAAYGFVLAFCTGMVYFSPLSAGWDPSYSKVPFVEGSFRYWCVGLAAGLSVSLGVWQSAREEARGTWLLLLHRPLSREKLTGVKLLVGLATYAVCAGLPTLAFACWATIPGTHASPFEWSMTVGTWEVLFGLTALYLAAFLSGLRPGHWFGTRLLPLAAAAVLVTLIELLPGPPVAVRLAVLVLLDAALVSSILFVSRTRDY